MSDPEFAKVIEQSERQAAADQQWNEDRRLRQVLSAWSLHPSFLESLLSWGFRIEAAQPTQPPQPLDVERLKAALLPCWYDKADESLDEIAAHVADAYNRAEVGEK